MSCVPYPLASRRMLICVVLTKCNHLLSEKMKRRTEPEFSSPQKKQKKKAEDLGLTLSSTSDDEAQLSNHTTQGTVGGCKCCCGESN